MKQPQAKPLTRSDVEAAAKVLHLTGDLDVLGDNLINAHYRAELRKEHPDTGGPTLDAASRVAALQAARKTLLQWLAERPDPDCICRGTGFVPTGSFKTGPCPQCGSKR